MHFPEILLFYNLYEVLKYNENMKIFDNEKINIIFKGDQNILWDALITDISLFNASQENNSQTSLVPFIHDEKIGTPDQNLSYYHDLENDNYSITEDYSDSSGVATYTNIDTSYGIFYLPALELAHLNEYRINVRAISKKYIHYFEVIDKNFIRKISEAGFQIDPDLNEEHKSFGKQKIFYLFTKSIGKFGIVPEYDQNYLFSSIKLKEANIKETLKSLFFDYLLKGLLEQAYSPKDREEIKDRSNNLINYLKDSTDSQTTITDLETLIFEFISKDLGIENKINLLKSSIIFASPKNFGINNFFLNIALKETEAFINAYNKALNETKLDIQRIRLINDLYNIPFYINTSDANGKIKRIQLFLEKNRKILLYKKQWGKSYKEVSEPQDGFITGKAIPFINELRIFPNTIALPEQGSKYVPAADAFIRNLRFSKIDVPKCRTIRICLNFLDNLKLKEDFTLILPKIFEPFFGTTITCSELALNWRVISNEIFKILEELKKFKEGQEVKEARFILEKNKFMSFKLKCLIKELLDELDERTKELRTKKNYATTYERLRVQILRFEIELTVNFYKQRLLSIANGLFYLNDRPYSIAIYLMFGAKFINLLLRNVTFRNEIV